jgi:hypothetical protein
MPATGDKIIKLQAPRTPGASPGYPLGSKLDDILGLESFSSLDHLKLNLLVLLERLETFSLDGGMMHEDIGAVLLGNEAITLSIVEPFHLTLHFHAESILLKIGTTSFPAQM